MERGKRGGGEVKLKQKVGEKRGRREKREKREERERKL